MSKRTVLIIDKDKDSSKDLKNFLTTKDYKVEIARDEIDGKNLLIKDVIDLIIICIGNKDGFGLDIIGKFRLHNSTIPILVISSRSDVESKIIAFNSGANDLIVKPYNNFELLARISNQMRNAKKSSGNIFTNGELKIDYEGRVVYMQNHEVHLTNLEYKILVLLANNLDKVLPYDYIIETIWGKGGQDYNGLRVFMSGIRNKLKTGKRVSRLIRTQVNVGYRMKKLS